MKVAVTGASGLLGAHLATALARDHEVVGIDRQDWWGDSRLRMLTGDLLDPTFRQAAMRNETPDVIIHCAAKVDVDACEREPAAAYELNASATGDLARLGGPESLFVYVTTDSIFKGDRPLAAESDPPCPRTVYARSKLHGEWEVQLSGVSYLILRTNFYGWSSGVKRTFGEWVHGALERREPITLFDDVFFTPIYVVDLVDAIVDLLRGRHRGVFHVVGRDRISKYRYGLELARLAGLSSEAVRRGALADVPLAAPRSKDMSLSCAAFERAVGRRVPDCASGLARFLADRTRPLSARVATVGRL